MYSTHRNARPLPPSLLRLPPLAVLAALTIACAPAASPASQPTTPATPLQPAVASQPASSTTNEPASAKPDLIRLRIGLATETLGWAPLCLGARRGFFRQAGLELERVMVGGNTALASALLAGEVDVAGFGPDTVLKLAERGREVKVFYAMGTGHSSHLVVGTAYAADKGVAPSHDFGFKVGRLKGIRLGAPSLGGLAELYSRWILRKGGLVETDVEFFQVGGGASGLVPLVESGLVAAVEKGQIDGFFSTPPVPQDVQTRGRALVLIHPGELSDYPRYIHSSLTVSMAFAARNATALQALSQALDRGKTLVHTELDTAVTELGKDFPRLEHTTLRESLTFYAGTFGDTGRMEEQSWRDTLGLYKEAGLITGEPNTAEGHHWTNQLLPQARPSPNIR